MFVVYKQVWNKKVSIPILDRPLAPVILLSVPFSKFLFREEADLFSQMIVDSHTKTNPSR